MPRKSIALFLATTGLISSLAGCSASRDAGEQGGETMKPAPSGQSAQPTGAPSQEKGGKEHKGSKEREGGEGGEGGEG